MEWTSNIKYNFILVNFNFSFSKNDISLKQGCDIEDLQHYHCKDDGCETVFRNEDGVREHGRNHFIQDQITEIAFLRGDPEESEPILVDCPETCPVKNTLLKNSKSADTPTVPTTGSHFHCKWVSLEKDLFLSRLMRY